MEKQKSTNLSKRKNDIILIIALLVISAVGFIYLFAFRSSGTTVKVTIDGKPYGVYSLSQNITEDIRSGKDGSGFNTLIISGGKAHIESASCPDGICVAHRPVFRNGESIVCLPNRVVVTVITDNDTDAPDIVA